MSFLTEPGPFTELLATAIAIGTGQTPSFSTTGGTSDARFIKDYCPVVEVGLAGTTMHKADECVPVAEIQQALAAILRPTKYSSSRYCFRSRPVTS